MSSYAAVLASLGPILGCSWPACSPKNIVKYSIFVGFSRCFSYSVTYALGGLLVLSWTVFLSLLGSLLASLGPLGLPFGLSWASLGPILGHFGAFLGLSWRLLCLSKAYLGPSLACSSSGWPSVPHWVSLSSFLGPLLGSFLDSLGPLLVLCWLSCSSFLALQRALLGPLELSWASQASSRVFSDLALHLQSGSVRCSQVTPCSLQPTFANSRALI